jgi:hypothetical protein
VIEDNRALLETMRAEEFVMGNKRKLRGNPFASTYVALFRVLQHNPSRFSNKRGPDSVSTRPAKRMVKPDAARPQSFDSSSTAHSGNTAESKDEEFTRSLLNAFVDDVLLVLQCENQTELTWPTTPYYVELMHRYLTSLQD